MIRFNTSISTSLRGSLLSQRKLVQVPLRSFSEAPFDVEAAAKAKAAKELTGRYINRL